MFQERKLVLVHRKTRLVELQEKYCTLGQAKFYLEQLGENFEDYLQEHNAYMQALQAAEKQLRLFGKFQKLERDFLPSYVFAPDDIIVVTGQDGLVANTLKYLTGQPVIAINPIPGALDGILLPFTISELQEVTKAVIGNQMGYKRISMAEVKTNLGEQLLAVNDLFIGPKTHTSARYEIEIDNKKESQSSSGVIVSTGLGSTGWMRSVLAGASGIAKRKVQEKLQQGIAWDSSDLHYSVREPFPSVTTQTDIVFGRVSPQSHFQMTSKMAENGVIFSDGIESDCIQFNAGTIAKIRLSNTQGMLVV
jgi:NAD kinase